MIVKKAVMKVVELDKMKINRVKMTVNTYRTNLARERRQVTLDVNKVTKSMKTN